MRLRAVDESVQYRYDLAARGVVESAVRAAGSIPTQGGGTRVIPSSTHALTSEGAQV